MRAKGLRCETRAAHPQTGILLLLKTPHKNQNKIKKTPAEVRSSSTPRFCGASRGAWAGCIERPVEAADLVMGTAEEKQRLRAGSLRVKFFAPSPREAQRPLVCAAPGSSFGVPADPLKSITLVEGGLFVCSGWPARFQSSCTTACSKEDI